MRTRGHVGGLREVRAINFSKKEAAVVHYVNDYSLFWFNRTVPLNQNDRHRIPQSVPPVLRFSGLILSLRCPHSTPYTPVKNPVPSFVPSRDSGSLVRPSLSGSRGKYNFAPAAWPGTVPGPLRPQVLYRYRLLAV